MLCAGRCHDRGKCVGGNLRSDPDMRHMLPKRRRLARLEENLVVAKTDVSDWKAKEIGLQGEVCVCVCVCFVRVPNRGWFHSKLKGPPPPAPFLWVTLFGHIALDLPACPPVCLPAYPPPTTRTRRAPVATEEGGVE